MTLKQQTHTIIDGLSEDNARLMVNLMEKITGNQAADVPGPAPAEKIRAFHELQEMRKSASAYGFSDFETEREAAMIEKYGDYVS